MDNLVLICVCIFVMPLLSVDCMDNRKDYIQLEEPMKNQTRMVGKMVKLKCIVSGYPRPEFTWYKDGKLIEAGVKTIKRGSRLVLRSLQVTATGQYECVARNSQGVVSTGSLLVVKKDEDKPYFNFWLNRGNDGNNQVKTNHSKEETASQETVTVVAGQPVVLPCSVQNLGNKYKVVWTDPLSMILSLEDRMIIDDRRFSIERPSMSDWNLKIIEVDRPDQGNYTCQINTEPVKSKVVTLHVEEPIYTTNASTPTTSQTPSTEGLCVNNSIPMCKGLGYSSVYMPHNKSKTIEEVGLELHQFWPIVEIQCSGAFKPFLCYMYAPPCSKPRMPCRSLCEEARMGCEPLMNNYGFRWPDSLDCTRLPAKDCLSSDSTDNIYSHNVNNNTLFYDLLRQPSYTTRASRASTAQMSTKTTEIPPTKVESVSSGGGTIFIEAYSSVYIRDNAYRGFKYQPVTTDLYVNPRNFDMIRIEDLQTERRDCPLEMTECYVMKFRRYVGSNRQQSYTEIALAFSHIDEFNKARGISNKPPKL